MATNHQDQPISAPPETFLRITTAFKNEREGYQALAKFLEKVFAAAAQRMHVSAFVQARTKSPASFAEKVIRKLVKYESEPGYDITDRCGLRVICENRADIELLKTYVKNNFLIDEANSLDKSEELKVDSFGYRSVHYVIQLKDDIPSLAGIKLPDPTLVPRGNKGFKAEVQIRSLMEHCWAAGLHDRFYKTKINRPLSLEREGAGLAAALEAADARCERLCAEVDQYLGDYTAYMNQDEMQKEVRILKQARECEESDRQCGAITLRIARYHRLSGNTAEAHGELEQAFQALGDSAPADLVCELGYLKCLLHEETPNGKDFKRGIELLRKVAGEIPIDRKEEEKKPTGEFPELPQQRALRALACERLADNLCLLQKANKKEVRDYYRQAHELAPANPYYFTAYIEHQVCCDRHTLGFLELAAPLMRQAIDRCREHIDVGIELPQAYFTIARLHILLWNFQEAFEMYLYAIDQLLSHKRVHGERYFLREAGFLTRLLDEVLPENDTRIPQCLILRKLIQLASAVCRGRTDELPPASAPFHSLLREKFPTSPCGNALIIAGGAFKMNSTEVSAYKPLLQQVLRHADGLVISGGTKVGIPGLVGEVVAELRNEGAWKGALVGYIPRKLPTDAPLDNDRYDAIFQSEGDKFSALESLQNWIDLLQAGLQAPRVRLLGINGGDLSTLDYRMALAMGAKVGIIERSGRAADAILLDPLWKKHPRLLGLPPEMLDEATLRAFVRPPLVENLRLQDEDTLDKLAGIAHDFYIRDNPYSETEPSRLKYAKLRKDFKDSNRQQVLYACEILKASGYDLVEFKLPPEVLELEKTDPKKFTEEVWRIVKETTPPELLPVTGERALLDQMGALEHGRWNIERLSSGWRPGPKKDVALRLSDCLKPYEQLPDHIRQYDRNAIQSYAFILAQVNLRIVKINHPAASR